MACRHTVDFAAQRTVGLLNPDGIIAEVPGSSPKTILYLQKILNGDQTPPRLCRWPSNAEPPKVFNEPAASHDISIPRMASTEDGINFTDLGPLNGLNDITGVGPTDIRYFGPRGTLHALWKWHLGTDLLRRKLPGWRLRRFPFPGLCPVQPTCGTGPSSMASRTRIASTIPLTVNVNGSPVTIPANQPVVGNSLGWFNGRIYGPSFVQMGEHDGVMTFTGYHTPRPNDDRGDTRGIGSVRLHSSENIVAISNGDDEQTPDNDDSSHGQGKDDK